jgi:aryl-alcohol dehydrogenase-like predicted oxidoreductase
MSGPDIPYTSLGRTGVQVSRLCLGTMLLPDPASREGSEAIIHRAVDAGINFFDTANVYGDGRSESVLGDAIQEYDRDDLVIATKAANPIRDTPNGSGMSRKHLLSQIDRSLDRLGTDYVDLYQIHTWDPNTPIREAVRALQHLVDAGKVRYVGVSHWHCRHVMKALMTADDIGGDRLVTVQSLHNLVKRSKEPGMTGLCREEGVGMLAHSPLDHGFLTNDTYHRDETPPADSRMDAETLAWRYDDEDWDVLEVARGLSDERSIPVSQLALAWLLRKDYVDAPIVGPRTVDHLDDAIEALAVDLTDDEVDRLEAPKSG